MHHTISTTLKISVKCASVHIPYYYTHKEHLYTVTILEGMMKCPLIQSNVLKGLVHGVQVNWEYK